MPPVRGEHANRQRACNRKKEIPSDHGFTLVELLTAVAILALLAGLGVAGFQHAISASHTGQCAANLRTMAWAVLAYSADEGGKIPPAIWSNGQSLNSALRGLKLPQKPLFRTAKDFPGFGF